MKESSCQRKKIIPILGLNFRVSCTDNVPKPSILVFLTAMKCQASRCRKCCVCLPIHPVHFISRCIFAGVILLILLNPRPHILWQLESHSPRGPSDFLVLFKSHRWIISLQQCLQELVCAVMAGYIPGRCDCCVDTEEDPGLLVVEPEDVLSLQ